MRYPAATHTRVCHGKDGSAEIFMENVSSSPQPCEQNIHYGCGMGFCIDFAVAPVPPADGGPVSRSGNVDAIRA